jgi:putative sterol carrier protein
MLNPSAMSVEDFARTIKAMKDDRLRQALEDPVIRQAVLDRVIDAMQQQFRPNKAVGVDATVHWKVFDKPGGGYDHFELIIRDQSLTANREPRQKPDVEIKADPVTFAKALTGAANTTMLAVRGKLRVAGDLNLARKIDGWFERPKT